MRGFFSPCSFYERLIVGHKQGAIVVVGRLPLRLIRDPAAVPEVAVEVVDIAYDLVERTRYALGKLWDRREGKIDLEVEGRAEEAEAELLYDIADAGVKRVAQKRFPIRNELGTAAALDPLDDLVHQHVEEPLFEHLHGHDPRFVRRPARGVLRPLRNLRDYLLNGIRNGGQDSFVVYGRNDRVGAPDEQYFFRDALRVSGAIEREVLVREFGKFVLDL